MFPHKSRCPEQVRFFTVGEQHDYVVRNRASGQQGPNGLENGGDAGAIISGTRSGFDAVVMGHKKDRWSATLSAGHSRENVLHSSGVGIACANTGGVLDLRLEPQVAELCDQVVAHPIMLRTPNRMRPLRDGNHMLHGALCRKRSRWSILWNGAGWTTHVLRKHDANCDKQKRNGQSLNRATFHRRQNMLPLSLRAVFKWIRNYYMHNLSEVDEASALVTLVRISRMYSIVLGQRFKRATTFVTESRSLLRGN
jgi:hypothetical protein